MCMSCRKFSMPNVTIIMSTPPLHTWETYCFCPGDLSVLLSVTNSCLFCNTSIPGGIFK